MRSKVENNAFSTIDFLKKMEKLKNFQSPDCSFNLLKMWISISENLTSWSVPIIYLHNHRISITPILPLDFCTVMYEFSRILVFAFPLHLKLLNSAKVFQMKTFSKIRISNKRFSRSLPMKHMYFANSTHCLSVITSTRNFQYQIVNYAIMSLSFYSLSSNTNIYLHKRTKILIALNK